ncbi:LysR family transcriptional regulator [Amphritea japonica]|uniref:LysR family transcriptional regulator n=1 Tax=Amphritea japonica ATCC BAA-1530 TaxID=1278309 RepID=A0A7R6SS02_9GAMM|nr:LysR family transcriptional regulator [Amphritea japonica]BBB25799.1 LysR family transcriptional regulator [Amphritea japonica ATCC BAA-1530]
MELQQLRLFLAAAESESFTRGAERSFVSQPALSASISKLETEVGVKLFTRNKRNVVLTPAGRKLLQRAKLIVGECARAKDELKQHEVQRRLRLGVINTLSITAVARLIEQYRRENPDLKLDVFDSSAADMLKLERDNRIDLALTTVQEGPPLNRRFQCAKPLFSEPYLVAMSRSHHFSKSKVINIKDLNDELFIGRSHCEHRVLIQNLMKQHNVKLNMAYVTNQDDRALALVEANIGLTIVPAHYASSRIITTPMAEDRYQRSIGFEWGENENMNEITQFVDFASTASWAYSES